MRVEDRLHLGFEVSVDYSAIMNVSNCQYHVRSVKPCEHQHTVSRQSARSQHAACALPQSTHRHPQSTLFCAA